MRTMIVWGVLVLAFASFGCRNDPASPRTAGEPGIPDPVLVPYSEIPNPHPNTLYRISGAELATGPTEILERVLEGGFDLQRAWHPQIALCMALFLDELIIELEAPNDDIYKLGFTSDFTGTAGPCASHWNEYDFVNAK
jgi:hypothetical protein